MPPDDMVCKSCGGVLGHPEDELHDPEGEHPMSQKLGISPDNPDAHIVVSNGPGDSKRLRCSKTGQATKVMSKGEYQKEVGEGSPSGDSQLRDQPRDPRTGGGIYEDSPDKDAMDILREVITNEAYELTEGQIAEVEDWGEIFDGQIAPEKLEAVLSNLSGVSNQKAKLIRDKYEAKISRWMREMSEGNQGPAIGGIQGQSISTSSESAGPTQEQIQRASEIARKRREQQQEKKEPQTPHRQRMSRRERRTMRRQDALDSAIDRAAMEMAGNFAQDFGTFFSDAREIMTTALKKKAESDPEWFFEKMEKWDMDLFDEVMSASEKKQEQQRIQRDAEVDDALEELMMGEDEGELVEQPTFDDGEQTFNDESEEYDSVEDPELEQMLAEMED